MTQDGWDHTFIGTVDYINKTIYICDPSRRGHEDEINQNLPFKRKLLITAKLKQLFGIDSDVKFGSDDCGFGPIRPLGSSCAMTTVVNAFFCCIQTDFAPPAPKLFQIFLMR